MGAEYWAGFIDADGCISLIKRKPYKGYINPVYELEVAITNADEEVIKEAKRFFGVGAIRRELGKESNHRDSWRWKAVSNQALAVLKRVLPHLKRKRKLALIGIEFQNSKPEAYDHANPLNSKQIQRRERLYQKMKGLNRKGSRSCEVLVKRKMGR